MERIFPTQTVTATLMWPVTGLATGTPVLVRKLTAPRRERRAEASALQAKQDELAAQAAKEAEAAWLKKLSAEADPTKRAAMTRTRETEKITMRQIQLEQAKADRKEKHGKVGEAAGAAALMLLVGGPLIWSLARPWVQPGIGLLLGVWWIAALIHAPAPGKTLAEDEQAPEQPVPAVEEEPSEEEPSDAPEVTAPTPADAHSLTASLTAAGSSVLLTRMAADLGAAHPLWKPSTRAVRALLAEAGIPVREGVRTPDGNGPGVHHQDVPALPSPSQEKAGAPVVANVAARQSANANANNADQAEPQKGFTTVPHPTDPARTIVIHPAGAA
ncbi:hypothetical protein ACIQC7_27860 [Kitasatospora sp. NPDC088556]|uniref:hypothetical protein n=1 Tax=Kitasatospora sp. NPDC088556 TaxID=3364076 RepID=UPI003813138A